MTFGSCLSSMTAENLKTHFSCNYICGIHHNRSDAFVRYYIENSSPMLPLANLEKSLTPLAEFGDAPKQFLRNQYPEYIGRLNHELDEDVGNNNFVNRLNRVQYDLIILDNFMDISAKLMCPKLDHEFRDSPLFINPHFYENSDKIIDRFQFGEFLTAQDSAKNWLTIFKWLEAKQPNAKIFFLCFPYCNSAQSNERYLRAKNFFIEFEKITKDQNISVMPPPDVALELTAGDDWYHLNAKVYTALAGYIFYCVASHIPRIGRKYVLL